MPKVLAGAVIVAWLPFWIALGWAVVYLGAWIGGHI